ncbi:MAG: hypothetical protein WD426_04520 [Anditalea sp.]
MRIKISLIGIFILSVFSSCKNNNQVETLKSEVMTIHDEVMPEMGTLMNLQKELKERISRRDNVDQSMADSLNRLVKQLEEADEAMMQWMRTYKEPSEELSQEEAMEYLEMKKNEILEVKEKIKTSETRAKEALQN